MENMVVIKDRALVKADAQIAFLMLEIEHLKETIPYMAYTQEMINNQLEFKHKELKTWEFIRRLVLQY